MRLIAKTLAGLEPVLAQELEELGAQAVEPINRAVAFEGDKALLYRANLELRTALRILLPVKQGKVRTEDELYRLVRTVDWSQYMKVNDTLAVDGVTNSKFFTHSKYVALKTKDAIVDQFREATGRRPNVNVYAPRLRVNVHIFNDECTIALDSSDDSLHKRGYRLSSVEAPINEVLAAGMVLLSGWNADRPLLDPMCGSGTLIIEAGLIATQRAPQLNREHFGFKRWPDFDEALWAQILEAAKQRVRKSPVPILGSDKDFKAMRLTEQNAMAASLEDTITVQRKKFEKLEPEVESGMILMNPPYDERLSEADIGAFYEMIGDQLKQRFTGFDAWIISSSIDGFKRLGLKSSLKIPLFNGALECRFVKYELYEGTRK
ncbi:THUMP domain-containing protein [Phaeodactylibacter sp.]|uniref:THUMP domain-containing class I SAM-dependent RNA methyltransferase n=1 Tax=Phaeodactylibacter sp. TaxID=1940289 RepID=UPI0025E8A0FB|nr:THUMP domain-containing protein [Phaeodactylibacter sp.]MCI4647035.1 THUMP domain-containing protein [Phaeodactylibacter sp.]MCI5091796.1 THUMP domain-containing protein [Phaeodactylibacter sp.]